MYFYLIILLSGWVKAQKVPEFALPYPAGKEVIIFSCTDPATEIVTDVYSLRNAFLEEIKSSGEKVYRADVFTAASQNTQKECRQLEIIVGVKTRSGTYPVTLYERVLESHRRKTDGPARIHFTFNEDSMALEEVIGKRVVTKVGPHNLLTSAALLYLLSVERKSQSTQTPTASFPDCLEQHNVYEP